MKKEIVSPEWISEETACQWLGVDRTTLLRMRTSLRLNFTYLGKNRVVMYDKAQINQILFNNSTYAFSNKKTA